MCFCVWAVPLPTVQTEILTQFSCRQSASCCGPLLTGTLRQRQAGERRGGVVSECEVIFLTLVRRDILCSGICLIVFSNEEPEFREGLMGHCCSAAFGRVVLWKLAGRVHWPGGTRLAFPSWWLGSPPPPQLPSLQGTYRVPTDASLWCLFSGGFVARYLGDLKTNTCTFWWQKKNPN